MKLMRLIITFTVTLFTRLSFAHKFGLCDILAAHCWSRCYGRRYLESYQSPQISVMSLDYALQHLTQVVMQMPAICDRLCLRRTLAYASYHAVPAVATNNLDFRAVLKPIANYTGGPL